jgi:cob(I)alamin adenosyltransferase
LYLKDIELLEKEIDQMNEVLPELRHFILPGGSTVVSYCHVARCVCRRAERICVHLSEESQVDETVMIYLNRLSDYLFVLARMLCFDQKIEENKWIPRV